MQIVDYVYKVLTQPDTAPQVLAPGANPAEAGSQSLTPRAKYPMLPHARPGGISGMLEILSDRDGHDDIYHLADDLSFEIDDVLPIVEASSMLGFLHCPRKATAPNSSRRKVVSTWKPISPNEKDAVCKSGARTRHAREADHPRSRIEGQPYAAR